MGETERYTGMFKSGLRSGVGKLETFNLDKNKW